MLLCCYRYQIKDTKNRRGLINIPRSDVDRFGDSALGRTDAAAPRMIGPTSGELLVWRSLSKDLGYRYCFRLKCLDSSDGGRHAHLVKHARVPQGFVLETKRRWRYPDETQDTQSERNVSFALPCLRS